MSNDLWPITPAGMAVISYLLGSDCQTTIVMASLGVIAAMIVKQASTIKPN